MAQGIAAYSPVCAEPLHKILNWKPGPSWGMLCGNLP